MLYEPHGRLLVVYHGRQTPTMVEWDDYLSICCQIVEAEGQVRILIYTDGGGPDLLQRRRLAGVIERVGSAVARTAIITDVWAVRQIVTMISWFNPEIRAFVGSDVTCAMDYLELEAAERTFGLETIPALRKRIGSSRSLACL